MKKAYQKQFHGKTKRGVRSGRAVPEDAVQLTLDRAEVLREMQEGLHRLGVTLGLELAALMMKDEVERLCGSRYEHPPQRQATRHGQQRGVITIAGQKIGIERPRVRSTRANRESVGDEGLALATRTGNDGKATIKGLPVGSYRVRVLAPPGYSLPGPWVETPVAFIDRAYYAFTVHLLKNG
jgi:hypothetical protein